MQKKLIALAIAGLSSAAFAQSNVTVYGVADASFESVSATGATTSADNIPSRTRVATNASLIGFKGTEDLGNGLKAMFQFETGVSLNNVGGADITGVTPTAKASTSNGALFDKQRDSYVGLSGGFGTVLAGYVSLPYRSIARSFDVVPGSTGTGEMGGVFGKATQDISFLARTNAVAYATPTMNGFSGVIAYVPNSNKSKELAGNTIDPHGWNLGLTYTTGGLKLAYSYLRLEDFGLGGNDSETHKVHLLGAGYDFGQGTTLNGLYQNFKGDASLGAVSNDYKRNSYWLGLKHVMGANEFAVAYAKANDLKGSGGVNDSGAKQWTLRYAYNLSKRTQAYALYSKITNESGAAFDFGTASVGAGAGADPRSLGVGIRHSF